MTDSSLCFCLRWFYVIFMDILRDGFWGEDRRVEGIGVKCMELGSLGSGQAPMDRKI